MKDKFRNHALVDIISNLAQVKQAREACSVLLFALSNKLLSACVFSGLLDECCCADELDKQHRARLKAAEALADISSMFSAAMIPYAVIKGFSFERAIYGDSPMRDVGDIDFLIAPKDALSAHKRLCDLGYKQQLGPSSGSIASLGRARFAARVSHQEYIASEKPLRRFPYKDAYCPYVKPGCPSVELHDGFRGLPGWYTDEAVERACGNRLSLMEDELDTMVFLLANTYENAESFYSNCFDDKIVLRDFVDSACYLRAIGDTLDWDAVASLIRELGIEEKAGRVLHDLSDLLPGEAKGVLPDVSRYVSLWGAGIRDRMIDPEMRRRCVLRVVRGDLRALARKAKIGLAPTADDKLLKPDPAASFTYLLYESGDGVLLEVDGTAAKRDGSCLVEIGIFPIAGEEQPLWKKISILLDEQSPIAFCRDLDRLPDGFSMWGRAGIGLPARYGDAGEIVVNIPHEVTDALLHEEETALTAGIYDRKYGNVFWARCRGKAMLTGGVPIGHLSLYCGPGAANVTVELSFARCAIASNDARLIASLRAVLEGAAVGAPVDCDVKPVRGYTVMREEAGAYTVEADGQPLGGGLTREEASALLMQDITDWTVSKLVKKSALAHASSNLAEDGAVLCMGPSGSGKTSLALALASYWPLRGDECSCIDLGTGIAWAEPLPVNVKAGNDFALGLAACDEALLCESESHGRTFCFSRCMVKSDPKPLEPARIRAVVFPMYDEGVRDVEIGRPAHDALVPLLLGSLLGEGRPSGLLREFTRMVSMHGIKLLSVRYSDAGAAARAVVQFVESLERKHDVQVG